MGSRTLCVRRSLTAKGLIVSGTKVGTRVRPKADWNILDPDVLAWHLQAALSEDFVTDLFELRHVGRATGCGARCTIM